MPKSKRKPSSQQPTFFHRDVPQMPEGYYSSGPNPNLAAFVEQHATPYDPATDDYDVPPFDQPITTTKATAIYNMHTYWSKKPHDAIQQYIRHYTQPGDLVLDPFCGSGGTALAALMEGRAAIAIDLSPAATFITKNYCTPVDVDELQRAFEELERRVKPEMNWLYETRCDRCDGRATTAYTVYSYVFQCPRCLEKVALFDCPEAQSQTLAGKPKTIRVCPHCQARGVEEEIKTSSKRYPAVPVLVSYLCEEGCKPQRGERRHNDPDEKKRAFFQRYDLGKIREIEEKPIPYWFPTNRMMNSTKKNWGLLWRRGIHEWAERVDQFFTKRNLWALSLLLNIVERIDNPSLLYIFESNIFSGTILQQYREAGGGFAKGTYYIPQVFMEREQWGCFSRKANDIIKAIEEINQLVLSPKFIISTQTAVKISEITSNSLDYIFTDPPYSGNVQYGELNFLWEIWLKFDTRWHSEEIIVNDTRGKTDTDWADLLQKVMVECYRVLKPGHWISVCYHDTSEGTWQLLQDIMAEVGFISEESEITLFIDAGQKSSNQLTGEKVTKRDLVINFRKPRPGELAEALLLTGDEDETTFQQKATAILAEALTAHPGQTADRLYDLLVSRMVRKGQFERHNFDELLNSIAEPVSEDVMKNLFEPETPDLFGGHQTVRWYLKATADVLDEIESRKETAAAHRLETYMQATLAAHSGQEGVHYSDLFEQYLPIGDKPRRLLQEWLPEFFYKTAEGTWRPPRDEAERQQKAELRSSGSLRRIKRFANALLDGVPPHARDVPDNAATLADWLYQCRRAGLYDLGRALYEKGGFAFEGLSEELRLQVEEDYQICARRSEVKAKPRASKPVQAEIGFEEMEA